MSSLHPVAGVSTLVERIRRVRQQPRRRRVQVLRVEALSPHACSITFAGDDLADFSSHAFDDHIKVFLPTTEGQGVIARDYTPRRFNVDQRELCIEFALHGEGPATCWARSTRPGDWLTIGGPRGSFIVPSDLDWYLLVGDCSSLPAVLRRLEELPATTQAHAIVQMDVVDQRALPLIAQKRLHWVSDNATCLMALHDWQPPPGIGYAWCAGEAGHMREVRRLLVEDKQVDHKAVRAAAYWKLGTTGHHENLENTL